VEERGRRRTTTLGIPETSSELGLHVHRKRLDCRSRTCEAVSSRLTEDKGGEREREREAIN
jgi:hypothetical protein